jgi:multidrug efflux system membrane fusion protein
MPDPSSAPNPESPSAARDDVTPRRPFRQRRLAILAAALLLLALAGGGGYYWSGYSAEGQSAGRASGSPGGPGGKDRLTPIVVEAATTDDFPVRLSAIGTVIPRTIVTIRSRVEGTLDRLLFEEGQTVRAGELLAEIDPRPFEVALVQAQGQMSRDQALLANARADLSRYEDLARLDAIPTQQLDTQRALVRQYEAAVKVDQGMVDSASLQLSYTRVKAPADGRVGLRQVDPGNLVRSSDANGIVVLTQVQPVTVVFPIPEAELSQVLARLGLQAPRSAQRERGPRTERPAGEAPDAARAARRETRNATSAEGGGRQNRGDSPDTAGKARSPGSPLAVQAWDRDGKVLLATGELLTVDNQIDVSTGTVKVKAIFPNKDGALFPNQFVNVRLVVNELKDATVIASAAVQRGAKGAFVWLLKDDKTVSMRQVEVGNPDGDLIPVKQGLQAGDPVAVDGFDRLREGAKVEVVTRESRAVKAGPGKRGPRAGGPGGPSGTGGSAAQGGPAGNSPGARTQP